MHHAERTAAVAAAIVAKNHLQHRRSRLQESKKHASKDKLNQRANRPAIGQLKGEGSPAVSIMKEAHLSSSRHRFCCEGQRGFSGQACHDSAISHSFYHEVHIGGARPREACKAREASMQCFCEPNQQDSCRWGIHTNSCCETDSSHRHGVRRLRATRHAQASHQASCTSNAVAAMTAICSKGTQHFRARSTRAGTHHSSL